LKRNGIEPAHHQRASDILIAAGPKHAGSTKGRRPQKPRATREELRSILIADLEAEMLAAAEAKVRSTRGEVARQQKDLERQLQEVASVSHPEEETRDR